MHDYLNKILRREEGYTLSESLDFEKRFWLEAFLYVAHL